MGHTLKGHSLRVGGALVGAVAAMAMAAGPAQADAGACPTGWTLGGKIELAAAGVPATDVTNVRNSADDNLNGSICIKSVNGEGNTGYGVNVKDDNPQDLTIVFVPVPVA